MEKARIHYLAASEDSNSYNKILSDNSSEKIVYLVRHGESIGNITPVFQPLDSPLSDEGKRQANLIAERISNIEFEVLISSPLTRTKETSRFISKLTGKEIVFSDQFVERVKPTSITGKSTSDQRAMETAQRWKDSLFTPGIRVEDGENYDDVMLRADKALKFLVDRPERSIVVVTHGFFLSALVAKVLLDDQINGELFKLIHYKTETENTGLTALKYVKHKEKYYWKVWILNDHSHLG